MSTNTRYRPVPLRFDRLPPEEPRARARAFLARMRTRRSVRQFTSEPAGRRTRSLTC